MKEDCRARWGLWQPGEGMYSIKVAAAAQPFSECRPCVARFSDFFPQARTLDFYVKYPDV